MDLLERLPSLTKTKLIELRDALVGALGDDLQALVVYGSAVRGGFVEGRSDLDLLVVLAATIAPRSRRSAGCCCWPARPRASSR